jgi:hypothetical protein
MSVLRCFEEATSIDPIAADRKLAVDERPPAVRCAAARFAPQDRVAFNTAS